VERIKLVVRGMKIGPPFEGKREDSLEDVRLVDILWSTALGLAMVDFLRGAYFHMLHLKLALKLSDPHRHVRALAVEAALLAGWESDSDRANRVLAHLRGLAEQLDEPHANGMCAIASAFSAFFSGRFREAATAAEFAIDVL